MARPQVSGRADTSLWPDGWVLAPTWQGNNEVSRSPARKIITLVSTGLALRHFGGLDRLSDGQQRFPSIRRCALRAGWPWRLPTRAPTDPYELILAELGGYLSGQATRPSETVSVTYPSPQQAVLEVNLDSPGLVVLADVYYLGWNLAIVGQPAPIHRVNGMMRGAVVSAGSHRLVYTYEPRSFRVGRLVPIAGLTAFLILGVACILWPVDPVIAGRPGSRGKSGPSNERELVMISQQPLTSCSNTSK